MPHVVVKLWPGRNDEIKTNLAKRIANVVVEELKVDIGDVSVAFEEVSSSDWVKKYTKKKLEIMRQFISSQIMNINKIHKGELIL